jgi:hypothetical protein
MHRSISKPLLVSIVLHAAVFLALLGIKHDAGVTTTPHIINVELVQLDEGVDPDGEARVESSDEGATGGRRGAENVEPLQPAPANVVSDASASTSEAEIIDAGEPSSPPPSRGSAPDTTAASPPESSVRSSPTPEPSPPTPTRESTPPTPSPAAPVASASPVSPAERSTPRPSTPAVSPRTLSIPDEQHSMLQEKFEEWTERFADLEHAAPAIDWEHDGQEYSATFTRLGAEDDMDIEQVMVAVSTEQNGDRLSARMRMTRLAFSSFAQFVDRWDPGVQIHDDEIDGRFHSNSEIHIAHSGGIQPSFRGKVTTSRGVNTSNSARRIRRNDVFLGGLETRVRRIALPKQFSPFSEDGPVDEARMQRFAEDTSITFYADGTYGWRHVESNAPEQRRTLSDEPSYIVAAEDADLNIRGTVKGKVLVYSAENIVIEDDLVYALHPETSDSDDYLGLVADRNVEIADPDTTGPGDLRVHAAIYAKRRFVVRRYRARGDATFHLYGSLTAGTVSATEPRYRTSLRFDRRLENLRPPSFPMTDRYEVTAWDGRWTVEPGSGSN